jgi:uncharacterized protein
MTDTPPRDLSTTPPAAGPGARPDGRILEFLVCPVTRGQLQYDAARQELISRAARLAYPIREGIPILVPDEARHLDDTPPKRRVGD